MNLHYRHAPPSPLNWERFRAHGSGGETTTSGGLTSRGLRRNNLQACRDP